MIYAFGDYELDTRTVELRKHGEGIHLEPQVYGVLAHLIANRDRVVSKIELLDEVWPDRFVSESALTSRLQAARKACGDTGRDQKVIRTKHGRGYRFVADVVEYGTDTETREHAAGPVREVSSPVYGIVGRVIELELVDRAAADALGGAGRTIFVGGEAGMGKTTLVDTALERADPATGLRILRAQFRPHRRQPEPYVALLDALSRFGREHGDDVVAVLDRVAPMWLMQLPSLQEPDRLEVLERRVLGGTHERMLREGVELLEQLAGTAPLVVVIEDAHWADPASIELVEWLAGRAHESPMLVVVTYRPGEEASGDLDALVARLSMARAVESMMLAPLDEPSVGQVIVDQLDAGGVDDEVVGLLAERAGGNPLFVNEQVASWLRDGVIEVIGEQVRATNGHESLHGAVPEGIRQLIERSLERMDDADVAVLEVGSVVGREFPAFAVAAAFDTPIHDVEDRLGGLARRGSFLNAVGDDSWPDGTISTVFRLSHDLHHQVLYDRIAASRRARLHQMVGERLESAYASRTDEHVTTLLRHFESSGDLDRSIDYLKRTGELAVARSSHAGAIEPLTSALELLERQPAGRDRDEREVDIRTTLGPALVATMGWRQPEVQANYERALTLACDLDADPERFIVRYGLAVVHELRGEYNRSEELLDAQMADGIELGVETRELLACSTFHQGAHQRSLEHAVAAVDLWDPETHSIYMARYGEHPGVSSSTWGALSAWYLGRPALSMEMAERAVDWGADNEYALTTAYIQMAFLRQYRDEADQCRTWAEKTVAVAREQGFPFREAQGRILSGWSSAAEGDAVDGRARIERGIERYRQTGARMDEPYYLGLRADAELRGGDPDAALASIDEAEQIIERTTRSFFYEPELYRLRALALLARGGGAARGEAGSVLSSAARLAAEHGAIALAMRVAVTMLEQGLADPRSAAIEALTETLETYRDHAELPDVKAATALLAAESSS